jgi:CheY-like chemotaxis protein
VYDQQQQQQPPMRVSAEGDLASSSHDDEEDDYHSLPAPFDFILCDNVMPNMDGPTAVKKIRELGYTRPIFGE